MSELETTVLLVDDDLFVRAMLRDALADSGLAMIEACDGDEAVALAAAEQPALVVLDLLMPRKSGLEAIPEILQVSPNTRIIVLTSMDAEGMQALAFKAGAVGFVAKPFHPLEIVSAVSNALQS